jgi:hypothetical protein
MAGDFKALNNKGVTKIKTREPKIHRPLLITSRSMDYAIKMSKMAERKGPSPFMSKTNLILITDLLDHCIYSNSSNAEDQSNTLITVHGQTLSFAKFPPSPLKGLVCEG